VRAVRAIFVVGSLVAVGAGCELIAGLHDHEPSCASCVDAPADTPFEPITNADYSFTVSPPNVVIEPGGAGVPVAITVTRVGGFAEAIAISLVNGPAGVSGSAIIPGNQSTGTLNVFADNTAVPGQVTLATVAAQSTQTNVAATQPLGIRIGHLLLSATASTTFVVPQDVQSATVTAWGAGGGGGGATSNNTAAGGSGGAGGFAEATFTLTPGTTLYVLVGTEGGAGLAQSTAAGRGGGGGGFSAVTVVPSGADAGADASADAGAVQYFLVAGGGGGGGGGYYYSATYTGPGKVGGAGAGDTGSDGQGNMSGKGGTPDAGGATGGNCTKGTAGAYLQGGNGGGSKLNVTDGGVPGGGSGASTGGAGGGGGYYGGGGGSGSSAPTCLGGGGGGGGGGHVDPSGTGASTGVGAGTTPPNTNHKYYAGNAGLGGQPGSAGNPGLVVLSIP
jgi:hypothetical protein